MYYRYTDNVNKEADKSRIINGNYSQKDYLSDGVVQERMKIYKNTDGKCNVSGPIIRYYREQKGLSQEKLAAYIQLMGLDINQKAISRIETGDRVVPDYELSFFSKALDTPVTVLLQIERLPKESITDDKQ